jgi:hypothetical protein
MHHPIAIQLDGHSTRKGKQGNKGNAGMRRPKRAHRPASCSSTSAKTTWGTDSIWYGSPQDQIQAFRTFQISEKLREKHGYPEMTPALRVKVFGLNAMKPCRISVAEIKRYMTKDRIATDRIAYHQDRTCIFALTGRKRAANS